MNVPERIVRFIKQLDAREFYRLLAVALGIIVILVTFFIYRYYAIAGDLQRKMKSLNTQREATQRILTDYQRVRAQKMRVEELIERDVSFKIKDFFARTVQDLNLNAALKKDPTIARNDLVEGYREIRLDAAFSNITMQQLVMLLQKLEENERVYVRELHITATAARTLDILVQVATFEKSVSVSG